MTNSTIHTHASLTVWGAQQATSLFYMFKKDPDWTLFNHQWDPQRAIPDLDPPICPACGSHDDSENCYTEEWHAGEAEAYITRYTCGEHVWTTLRVYPQ